MNFEVFKNANVRHALELRKQGKYKEAISFLDKACDEGDGEAWYIKGYFYELGGCGLRQDLHKASVCMAESRARGCYSTDVFVKAQQAAYSGEHALAEKLRIDALEAGYFFALRQIDVSKVSIEIVQALADNGDGYACLFVAGFYYEIGNLKKALAYLRKGAEQKVIRCLRQIINPVWLDAGEISFWECSKWEVKTYNSADQLKHLIYKYQSEADEVKQQLFYMVGRKVAKHFINELSLILTSVLQIYQRTWAAAHNATVTFLLCCKQLGVYKDVAKMIGKFIWESRINPDFWEEEKNKKIKFSFY